jgi:hypothetical protein
MKIAYLRLVDHFLRRAVSDHRLRSIISTGSPKERQGLSYKIETLRCLFPQCLHGRDAEVNMLLLAEVRVSTRRREADSKKERTDDDDIGVGRSQL